MVQQIQADDDEDDTGYCFCPSPLVSCVSSVGQFISDWCPCTFSLNCQLCDGWKRWISSVFPEGAGSLRVGVLSIFFTTIGAGVLCLPWCVAQMGIVLFVVFVVFCRFTTSASLDVFIDSVSAVQSEATLLQDALSETVGGFFATSVTLLTVFECLMTIAAHLIFSTHAAVIRML